MAVVMVGYTRVVQLSFVHFPQMEAEWIFQPEVVAVESYYLLNNKIDLLKFHHFFFLRNVTFHHFSY